MPDRTEQTTDPIAMLKEDHQAVQQLFDEFEQTNNSRSKARIAREALTMLDVHAGIEEEIFYPAFQSEAEDAEDIVLEAEEEHHVVHVLIAELHELEPSDPRYEAKFTVLAENVRHHIKEEEQEMLPKARKLGKERLADLGEQMATRRRQLQREMGTDRSADRKAS
ncbi:MAG: hemerythrin domain-containing protein [Dehalococcoidia bacterium]